MCLPSLMGISVIYTVLTVVAGYQSTRRVEEEHPQGHETLGQCKVKFRVDTDRRKWRSQALVAGRGRRGCHQLVGAGGV